MPDDPTKPSAQWTPEEMRELKDQVALLERRVSVVESQAAAEPLDDELVESLGAAEFSPGFVTDEGVARATPCACFELGSDKHLCFSKGVIGALDEGQQALYCAERKVKPLSDEQRRRIEGFKRATRTCKERTEDLPKGERGAVFRTCVETELIDTGIKV